MVIGFGVVKKHAPFHIGEQLITDLLKILSPIWIQPFDVRPGGKFSLVTIHQRIEPMIIGIHCERINILREETSGGECDE